MSELSIYPGFSSASGFEDTGRLLHLRVVQVHKKENLVARAHLVARQGGPWDDRQEPSAPGDQHAWHASVCLLLLPHGRWSLDGPWMVSHLAERATGVCMVWRWCHAPQVLGLLEGHGERQPERDSWCERCSWLVERYDLVGPCAYGARCDR